jgi:5-methyltetrahydropteroyltriglutamate--homocysteine methyltransferase
MPLQPLMTQIVGTYAKPHWLGRHQRMRALDGSWWRPEPLVLQEAKEDAALLALYEQERAGLDLVTDGEAQRSSYDRHFLQGLTGIDLTQTEQASVNSEVATVKRTIEGLEEYTDLSETRPSIVGEVRWTKPIAVDELRFLKRHARKPAKVNVIGPLSLFLQTVDRFYYDREAAVMALAYAINQELLALEAAGADVIQLDEPAFHSRLSLARRIGRAAIARAVEGVRVPVLAHVCYGYAVVYKEKSASPSYPEVLEILADCPIAGISLEYEQPKHDPSLLRYCGDKHVVLGLLDLSTDRIETPQHIATRLCAALEVVPAARLHPSSDCGMWHLPRTVAFGKISALVAGAGRVRAG